MKKHSGFLLLTVFIIAPFCMNGQDTASVRNGASQRTTKVFNNNTLPNNSIIEERLVALALQGPRYRVTEYQNKINEYALKRSKAVLLNQIAISSNINGQTFTKTNSPTAPAVVYPKLTAGISIPLGTIFSRTEVKAAREQVKMGKDIQEQQARAIKKDVLSLYLQYKSIVGQMTNLTLLVDDQTAVSGQVKQQLKDGKITFEEYGNISQASNASSNALIQLQLQRDLFKLQIEEMIGVPLEDVLSGKIIPEAPKL